MPEEPIRLWEAWRARGDARAFEDLVRPELGRAVAFARSEGCPPGEAEDAVQESLIRLAQEKSDTPTRVGVRGWFFGVVRDRARSRLRSNRRRRRREQEAAVREAAPGEIPPFVLREEVDRALSGLPEDEREALRLRYLLDLEYREVAYVLCVSEGACRMRVLRALKRVRSVLGASAGAALATLFFPEPARASSLVSAAVASAPSTAAGSLGGTALMTMTQKSLLGTALAGLLGAALGAGAALRFGPARSGGDTDALAADVVRLRSAVEAQAGRIATLESSRAAASASPGTGSSPGSPAPGSAGREGSGTGDRPSAAPSSDGNGSEILAELKANTDGARVIAIREALQGLVRIGDPVVPEIVAILDSGLEKRYVEGKPMLQHVKGYTGLRMVLKDALREIGTPKAKAALLQAVRNSGSVADFRDLIVPSLGVTDPALVQGITDLLPEMLLSLAKGGFVGDDGEAADLGGCVEYWLRKRELPVPVDALEAAMRAPIDPEHAAFIGYWGLFAHFVEAAPERAAQVALELHGRGLKQDPLYMLGSQIKYSVPLAQQVRYYDILLTKGDLAPELRMNVFAAMPDGPPSGTKDPQKAAEEAEAFATFLQGKLDAESDERTKGVIQRKIESLRRRIAELKK